jgi:hypothetical protein
MAVTIGNCVAAMAVGILVLLIQAGDSRRESWRRAGGAVSQEPARPEPAPTTQVEPSNSPPTPRTPGGPPTPVAPPPVATPKPPPVAPKPPAATSRPQVAVGPSQFQPDAPAPGAATPPASPSSQPGPPPKEGVTPKETAPPPQPPISQPDKPSAPTLDLAGLEQRLRDTKAIGVFTKLSLKNQVDDLLDEFRDFHRSRDQSMLTKLREAFDLLVLKVLSLLQDGDPALARDVASSREALWHTLIDPDTFKNL